MEEIAYKRLIEAYIVDLMSELPAIAVEGLKGVGKTISARRLSSTVFELDQVRDSELVANDFAVLSSSSPPVLIDEWQKIPAVWDYIRRQVDNGCAPGSYLLTGSIANEDMNIHSGAGRILKQRMYPLSLQERAIETPTVPLSGLLSQDEPFTSRIGGNTDVGYKDYMNEIIASGLPGVRPYSSAKRRLMLGTYLDYLLSHEFEQQGVRLRQPLTLLRWLKAYAAATSTDTGYNEILDASTAGEREKPSVQTTISYREALGNLWLLDELPMWLSGEGYFARLKRTPKHYLADPAIAAYLLNYSFDTLTKSAQGGAAPKTKFDEKYGSITGRLFESLIHLSLNAYASVNDAKLAYLKTRNADHEVDFIVQRESRVVAIEVKMAQTVDEKDVKNLLWLKANLKDDLTDALVVTTGPVAYRMPNGIAVVPAALLGA
jgi:predicted AAA+ superfamily ATPase